MWKMHPFGKEITPNKLRRETELASVKNKSRSLYRRICSVIWTSIML